VGGVCDRDVCSVQWWQDLLFLAKQPPQKPSSDFTGKSPTDPSSDATTPDGVEVAEQSGEAIKQASK
jgi:hypothetical protein